jgi:transcriptional regulator with XRE-family HTH domain
MEIRVEHTEDRLATRIKAARREAGLTQAELGEFVGADRYAIAALERGHLTTQVRRLLQVLDAVGLEIDLQPRTRRLATGIPEHATTPE